MSWLENFKKSRTQMWLKPVSNEALKRKRVFGFDIETYDNNKHFLLGSICADNFLKYFYKAEDMIEFIRNNGSALYVATNLQFDALQLFKVLKKLGGFKPFFRNSDMIGGTFGKAKFVDTMNYARLGVKNIGKMIGIEKMKTPSFLGKIPKDEDEWNYLRAYNHNDAWISYKFYRYLEDYCIKRNIKLKTTIASTAMDDFKRNFLKYPMKKTLIEDYKRLRLGYYGGRTEAFCRGNLAGKRLKYYDIRSHYPFIMKTCESPDPNTMHYFKRGKWRFIEEYEGISNVEMICPYMRYPFLPFRVKEKLVFPTGDISGWYAHVEIKKALSFGYKLVSIRDQYVYYKSFFPFKEYVSSHYNSRIAYEKEGNMSMSYFEKIMLNSLYGKFAERPEREEAISMDELTLEMTQKTSFNGKGDFVFVKRHLSDDETPAHTNPILSIYVTAWGRIKLYDLIVKYEAVYCDTDSLITVWVIPVSNELGGLKLEAEIITGCIYKTKMYVVDNDIKIKGLRLNRDKDDPLAIAQNFEKVDQINNGYSVPSLHFAKFKECQKSDKHYYNECYNVMKLFGLEDDKRRWVHPFNKDEFQDSEPLHSSNGVLNTLKNELMMRKLEKRMERKKAEELIKSDFFDRNSVGYDISDDEFIKNEQWFEIQDGRY